MPPFQNTDEPAHFVRAWQVSRGQFIGSDAPEVPPEFVAAVLRPPARNGQSEAGQPDPRLLVPFEWGVLQTQVYWFPAYLPAAAAIRFASLFHLSVFAMVHLARLANAAVFLAALVLALRAAPGIRGLLAALALMPMTWIVATSISADSATVALSFLFFAMIERTREIPVSSRFLAALLVLTAVFVPCKYSLWALPLLLLIPRGQFENRGKRLAWLTAAALGGILVTFVWRNLTADCFAIMQAAALSRGTDFAANGRLFASHPIAVFHDLTMPGGQSPLLYLNVLLHRFGGVYGWVLFQVPHVLLYLPVLAAAAIFESRWKPLRLRERLLLLAVFAAAAIGTYAALFVLDGIQIGGHARFLTVGVQGRYFIPYCLAGLLALHQTRWKLAERMLAPVVLLAGCIFGAMALWTMCRIYYS